LGWFISSLSRVLPGASHFSFSFALLMLLRVNKDLVSFMNAEFASFIYRFFAACIRARDIDHARDMRDIVHARDARDIVHARDARDIVHTSDACDIDHASETRNTDHASKTHDIDHASNIVRARGAFEHIAFNLAEAFLINLAVHCLRRAVSTALLFFFSDLTTCHLASHFRLVTER
jgi:hypothetical protein